MNSYRRLQQLSLLLVFCLCGNGCLFSRPDPNGLPHRHKVNVDQLQIRSDVKISKSDPLFQELSELREEIIDLLELPPPSRPVVVYLFKDEQRYAQYMQKQHPNLPPRRAFFIGSPTELAVYAHRGPSMMEDLRHECTHGVLHAALHTVPLWLDEGLAEYFETQTRDSRRRHPEHAPKLALAVANGWRPDLHRLEQIEEVSEMHQMDYQEAWAWVHYLLHDCPDGREMLIDYCRALHTSNKPPRFADRLTRHVPAVDVRLTAYVTSTFN